ncbi:alpha/beta-hydrolase [Backusella circina FSU 941]|nr:alpha/beta-hydrolase [Backusella circina FSU 941]
MSLFSLISRCILLFLLTSRLLNAQSAQPFAPSKQARGYDFSLIPFFNTLTKGLSNIVPPRGGIAKPTEAQLLKFKRYYKLSCAAYCDSIYEENHWTCRHCLESIPNGVLEGTFHDRVYDIKGFVARSDHDKVIYLVFRGSASVTNYVADLVFLYDRYPGVSGAYVHQGFYTSYGGIRDKFKPIVERVKDEYPSYKIVITGHSLGGALSIYAAMELYESNPLKFGSNSTEVYTFGSPRLGNDVFAKYVANTGIFISRTVHKNDFVPQTPRVSQGYLHVGIESFIYEDPDQIRICTSVLESSLCGILFDIRSAIDHVE